MDLKTPIDVTVITIYKVSPLFSGGCTIRDVVNMGLIRDGQLTGFAY